MPESTPDRPEQPRLHDCKDESNLWASEFGLNVMENAKLMKPDALWNLNPSICSSLLNRSMSRIVCVLDWNTGELMILCFYCDVNIYVYAELTTYYTNWWCSFSFIFAAFFLNFKISIILVFARWSSTWHVCD
jgi:hypothetical protein